MSLPHIIKSFTLWEFVKAHWHTEMGTRHGVH